MHVVEWTTIFQLAWKLVVDQLIRLGARLAWDFWSGQVTIKEFEIAGVVFPTTATEIANFSIAGFLTSASAVSTSSFADFHRSGRIKAHMASLLVVSNSPGPGPQRSLRDQHQRKKGDHKKTTSRSGVKGYYLPFLQGLLKL